MLIPSRKIPGSRDFAKSRPVPSRIKILENAGACWAAHMTKGCCGGVLRVMPRMSNSRIYCFGQFSNRPHFSPSSLAAAKSKFGPICCSAGAAQCVQGNCAALFAKRFARLRGGCVSPRSPDSPPSNVQPFSSTTSCHPQPTSLLLATKRILP